MIEKQNVGVLETIYEINGETHIKYSCYEHGFSFRPSCPICKSTKEKNERLSY